MTSKLAGMNRVAKDLCEILSHVLSFHFPEDTCHLGLTTGNEDHVPGFLLQTELDGIVCCCIAGVKGRDDIYLIRDLGAGYGIRNGFV